jgi:hypothetical protein
MDLEELIVKSLKHEEIPRVASFLQGVMPNFQRQWAEKYEDLVTDDDIGLTGTKDCTLHMSLGIDSSWAGFGGPYYRAPKEHAQIVAAAQNKLSAEDRSKGYSIGINGGLYRTVYFQETNTTNHFLVEGTIQTEQEWLEWYKDWEIMPESGDPIKIFNDSYHKALNFKKPHMLIPSTGLIMEPLISQIPTSRIAYFARKNPSFLHKICDFIVEPTLRKAKLMAESDAQVIIVPDDCAYKGRPILSPSLYREFIIPRFKKVIDIMHKAGKLVMFHSDGVVEPYYNDLISIGLDAHESLEPVAGNNLADLKARYGNRLAFVGNIDCSILLTYGPPDLMVKTVKETLRAGMPGYGYMFSPCTDFIDTNKLELAELMMETYRKYRDYPMNIH